MVKTDDYMEINNSSTAASFGIGKEEEEMIGEEEDSAVHASWLPPRSKSAGLKYAEYESDESGRMLSSKVVQDGEPDDRRLRRQIANCNERRRMQSINAGFQALRQLLPRKDGDKMSKASILAATAEFIQKLLHERNKLLEDNAMSAAKRRRLDVGEQNGAPTLDEIPANVIDCIKTIGQLRDLLQKETQQRMEYERELMELRKVRPNAPALPSPGGSEYSPNSSSTSSTGSNNRNLLVELRQQHQESQQAQHVFRPTPIALSDVNILSSAIASLANNKSPPGQPIGISSIGINNQQFGIHAPSPNGPGNQQNSGTSMFAASCLPQQISPLQQTKDQQTISQQNLQALVLAIRHLEGGNGNDLVR